MGLSVYLAADYARRIEMLRLADRLLHHGIMVTSGWLTHVPSNPVDGGMGGELTMEQAHECRVSIVPMDLRDIKAADVFLQFTTGEKARGGRHVELGYALALAEADQIVAGQTRRRRVGVCGPTEHAFHHHRLVHRFRQPEQALVWLLRLRDEDR